MEIATIFSLLDGAVTLTAKIMQEVEKAKKSGVVFTPEQQEILDRVRSLRTRVGL